MIRFHFTYLFILLQTLSASCWPLNSKNWGLRSTQSLDAAEIFVSRQEVVVAVIDTGIDGTHTDLRNNLWINPGESGLDALGKPKANNQIDDDKNGFIDDVHGYSFTENSSDLTDNHGHGTHVSAIIKAVNPSVKIMSLKYCDPFADPKQNLANTVKAIQYAIQMGAQIINYSGGGLGANSEEYAALEHAMKKGILVVAAAGNESSNTDRAKYFPASYNLENILSVTALDPWFKILASSNFGAQSVHIAAPGQDIYSALPDGQFGTMTGTSQATAFVSGAASMILGDSPEPLSPAQMIRQIVQTSDYDFKLKGKTKASSKLNTLRALQMKDQGVNTTGAHSKNLFQDDNEVFLLKED